MEANFGTVGPILSVCNGHPVFERAEKVAFWPNLGFSLGVEEACKLLTSENKIKHSSLKTAQQLPPWYKHPETKPGFIDNFPPGKKNLANYDCCGTWRFEIGL